MDRYLRRAQEILEIADAAPDSGALVILIGRQGGIRMLDPSGWSLDGLAAEFGAAEVYRIERRPGRVRVEGFSGGRSFSLSNEIASGIPRRLAAGR